MDEKREKRMKDTYTSSRLLMSGPNGGGFKRGLSLAHNICKKDEKTRQS